MLLGRSNSRPSPPSVLRQTWCAMGHPEQVSETQRGHAHTHTHVHATHAHTCTHKHSCTHTHALACMHTRTQDPHRHALTSKCTCTHAGYTNTHTHTHTHTISHVRGNQVRNTCTHTFVNQQTPRGSTDGYKHARTHIHICTHTIHKHTQKPVTDTFEKG